MTVRLGIVTLRKYTFLRLLLQLLLPLVCGLSLVIRKLNLATACLFVEDVGCVGALH